MTTKKLAVKFTQRYDDIQGRIEFPADNLFTLECLVELITEFSKHSKIPPLEIVSDLHAVLAGAVKPTCEK